MDCRASRALLSVHLDGFLAVPEGDELQAHLPECPACRSRLESLRAIKHAVARLGDREEPPGAVRSHVEALRLASKAPRLWRRCAWAAAVAAAVAGTALWSFRASNEVDRLADELVADHLHSVPEVRPAEVSSSDPAEIERFFARHLPFAAVVPDLPGAALIGGRLCQIEGRRVELLFYRHEDRTLSLFATDRQLLEEGCHGARGHQVCSRSMGGLTFLLVGELPEDELRRLLLEATVTAHPEPVEG
jgi:anti-sigma factor RsiW